MRIFKKGLLLVAVPCVFELLLLGLLLKTQRDATDAENWAYHSQVVIAQAAEVRQPILLQAARLRRAIILNNTDELSQNDLWDSIIEGVNQLEVMVADSAAQTASVRQLRQFILTYREWNKERARMIDAGDIISVIEDLRKSPSTNTRLEVIRNQINSFIRAEERLGVVRMERVARAKEIRTFSFILAFIGSIFAACIAAWLFDRDIRGRLAVLAGNARRLAEGATLADRVNGSDEISELDVALHQASARLGSYRSQLEKRAVELLRANDSLQRQTQDTEMFVTSVSHDLRSPLVNLQGFSNELGTGARELRDAIEKSDLPESEKQAMRRIIDDDLDIPLKFIRTAVTRSAAIIDSMLRLARIGRVQYQHKQVDVGPIVQRVADAMHGTIRARGARVIAGDLPGCYGDPTAVEQIFGNLIGNAVNYLDPARPGLVEIGAVENEDASAQFRTYYVRDNGLGIPAAYQRHLFTAFKRLHASAAEGEGIGLALIKRIVTRHGGKIRVESEEGKGTTFYVSLPARAVEQMPDGSVATSPVVTSAAATGTATITATSATPTASTGTSA